MKVRKKMKVRKMRLLRHKHHISLVELSDACGVFKQRLSEIELDKSPSLRSPFK